MEKEKGCVNTPIIQIQTRITSPWTTRTTLSWITVFIAYAMSGEKAFRDVVRNFCRTLTSLNVVSGISGDPKCIITPWPISLIPTQA